tara:strand:- start:2092 stop:3315 length:1224 start_codon:yes stop_codon:yes gene_type:complete
MEKFKSFITEQKNTHMTHIEDKVLYGGVDGTRQAINALRSLRDMLGGVHEGSVSVKWDGAPAIFAGQDPRDGKFFVAKKGIFNKNPMVYKTPAEVDADTKGDLAAKLKASLKYLPELGIEGVIQGDLLFTDDLNTEVIKGVKYTTFHPNTIIYAVPYDSPEAKIVRKAKVGVVWHTTYTGNTFESMKASYGVNVSKFNKSANVWSQDAMLRDVTKATMNKKDTEEVNEYLSQAGSLFNQIAGSTLRQLGGNRELAQHIEQYNNTFVRAGTIITDTRKHTDSLIKWINDKYQKEADKLKTDKGKSSRYAKRDELLAFFSPQNKAGLQKAFELQRVIVLAKLKLINTLNKLQNINTFVKTRNGFKVTGAEGFVAIDRLGSDAVKIVDRMEFSYNNFSADIVKGWDKPGR